MPVAVTVCLAVESNGRIDLFLRTSDDRALSALRELFSSLGGSLIARSLPFAKCERLDDGIHEILLSRIDHGTAEKIKVDRDQAGGHRLLWEGDDEYWKEVSDKCASLLEGGTGYQYLRVRGSESQNVTLSYRERQT